MSESTITVEKKVAGQLDEEVKSPAGVVSRTEQEEEEDQEDSSFQFSNPN